MIDFKMDRAPSLTEIFYESFTDPIFVTMFISSLIAFQIFQKLGHILWRNCVSKEQKEKSSKWLFGSYVQATLHSIIFIPAYYVIITYDTHDYIYKYFTIMSCAYYLNMIIYEIVIPQTSIYYMLLMIVHHTICGFVQLPIYCLSAWCFQCGILPLLSAYCFQCEISNLFMDISWFAQQFESKIWYKLSGYGILITFPLTRCVIVPIALYKAYDIYDKNIVPMEYYWFAMFGYIFVIIMSLTYSISILINPSPLLKMPTLIKKAL